MATINQIKLRNLRFNEVHAVLTLAGFSGKQTQGDGISSYEGVPFSYRYTHSMHIDEDAIGGLDALIAHSLSKLGFAWFWRSERSTTATTLIIDHPGDKPMPRIEW